MRFKSWARVCLALLWATAFLFVAASFGQVQMKQVTELSSRIEVARPEYKAAEAVTIRYTLTNTTGATQTVLKWGTPLEGFNGNIFRVTVDGKPVIYTGRVVKRGAPLPEEYVTLAPGASVSADVDLAQAYDISEVGDYSVEFSSKVMDLGAGTPAELVSKKTFQAFAPKALRSNVATFKITEQRPRLERLVIAPKEEPAGAKTPVFTGCTEARKSILTTALSNARTYSAAAEIALACVTSSAATKCPRYTEWFGAYDASRLSTVKNHFAKITDALSNKTITFNCGCNENYYAYVYPTKPYEIYLCNLFWSAPATGTDSQFGTIIHEVSHFNVVAGTDDHVYGQAGCRALAINNPSQAIDNADSHEYFAENTPTKKCCGLELTFLSLGLILLAISACGLVRGRRRVLF